ncbi:MAG: HEAT repeat domain-containing protein [Phycisphaerales bacterium JB040]
MRTIVTTGGLLLTLCVALPATGCAGGGTPAPGDDAVVTQSRAAQARERAIDTLLELVEDIRPAVRAHAIEALADAPERGADAIEKGLRDSNEGVRSVAAMVVGRAGLTDLAPWVRPLVHDDSPYVRASATYALSVLGLDENVSALAPLLSEHPDARVRAHAAFVLGELGDESALGLLRDAYRDPMPRANTSQVRLLRLQIGEAMAKLGDDDALAGIRAALFPSRPEEMEYAALAIQIIGAVGDENSIDQFIYLAEGISEQPMPAEIRLAAADALARLGHPQGAFIADEYARSDSDAVRGYAAVVYGRTESGANLDKLLVLLEDRSISVRAASARGILELTSRID